MIELFGDFMPCFKTLNGKCWILVFLYTCVIVAIIALAIGNQRSNSTARSSAPTVRRAARTENRRPDHLTAQEAAAPKSPGKDA